MLDPDLAPTPLVRLRHRLPVMPVWAVELLPTLLTAHWVFIKRIAHVLAVGHYLLNFMTKRETGFGTKRKNLELLPGGHAGVGGSMGLQLVSVRQ